MRRKLITLLAVFAVLAIALGVFVFMSAGQYGEASEALQEASSKFHQLTGSRVFPSSDNARELAKQAANFEEYLSALRSARAQNSPDPGRYTRDRWQSEFNQTINEIQKDARAHGVNLNPQTAEAFGFDYFRQSIPPADDLQRLFPQLHAVKSLCHTLFEARITELIAVEREAFEKIPIAAPTEEPEQPRRRGRRGAQDEAPDPRTLRAAYTDPDNLFIREHFKFIFRAHDESVWAALESFARQESPFVVVTRVDILNSARPAVVTPRAPDTPPAAPPPAPVSRDGFRALGAPAPAPEKPVADEPLSREARRVAGDDLPIVTLELDVYRFIADAAPDAADAQAEPTPEDD